MAYIINDSVVFSPADRTLHMIGDENNVIELSPLTTSKLLEKLIECNNHIISKDDLLISVWEENGYKASTFNLSKSISTLRKGFKSIGLTDDIIETIPKQGFILHANIRHLEENKIKNNLKKNKKSKLNKIMLFLPVLSILVIFAYYFLDKNSTPITEIRLKKCTLNILDQKKPTNEYMDNLVRDFDCDKNKVDFYYDNNQSGENIETNSIEFLASCTGKGNDKKCSNQITFH